MFPFPLLNAGSSIALPAGMCKHFSKVSALYLKVVINEVYHIGLFWGLGKETDI